MDSSSFKTSLGKKLIAVALCVTAFVFLSISVFAGVDLSFPVSVGHTYTSGYVDYNITVTRLVVNADSVIVGGATVPYLVTATVRNRSTTDDALVTLQNINFDFSASTQVMSWNVYSKDLLFDVMTTNSNGTIYPLVSIVPSNEFSNGGSIVVPKNTTLYLIGEFSVYCSYDSQNQSWNTTIFNGFSSGISNVTMGDYAHCDSVDLSPVLTALSSIENNQITYTDLQNIVNQFIWNGILPNYNMGNEVARSISANSQGVSVSFDAFMKRSFILTEDTEITPPNVVYSGGTRVKVVDVQLYINNTNGYVVELANTIGIIGLFQATANPIVTSYCSGNLDVTPLLYSTSSGFNIYFVTDSNEDSKFIIPAGRFVIDIQLYIYEPISGSNPTLFKNASDISIRLNVNGKYDDDYTDELQTKSEAAHVQEQNYFTQNAQAIQNTGLSNYRFNGDQENGIGSVSHDFTLLWNALGGFNSVYIFSLTLSLALMVLRHAPNAIKSSRRNKEE